jgi:hypothetical protein
MANVFPEAGFGSNGAQSAIILARAQMERNCRSMQELVARIAQATGLDQERAERGLAIVLALIKSHGDAKKVTALFEKMPGAEQLAERQAAAKSGLIGRLGGGLMGAPLAAVSQLQAAGFSMAQIKVLGSEVLTYAREKAGDRLVREAAGSIPGLASYL